MDSSYHFLNLKLKCNIGLRKTVGTEWTERDGIPASHLGHLSSEVSRHWDKVSSVFTCQHH